MDDASLIVGLVVGLSVPLLVCAVVIVIVYVHKNRRKHLLDIGPVFDGDVVKPPDTSVEPSTTAVEFLKLDQRPFSSLSANLVHSEQKQRNDEADETTDYLAPESYSKTKIDADEGCSVKMGNDDVEGRYFTKTCNDYVDEGYTTKNCIDDGYLASVDEPNGDKMRVKSSSTC